MDGHLKQEKLKGVKGSWEQPKDDWQSLNYCADEGTKQLKILRRNLLFPKGPCDAI